uniref:Uncharacterized protein n=1 Tax=Trichuris muris TaxID=70415 RepID=A0A5S6QX02_TRIMR
MCNSELARHKDDEALFQDYIRPIVGQVAIASQLVLLRNGEVESVVMRIWVDKWPAVKRHCFAKKWPSAQSPCKEQSPVGDGNATLRSWIFAFSIDPFDRPIQRLLLPMEVSNFRFCNNQPDPRTRKTDLADWIGLPPGGDPTAGLPHLFALGERNIPSSWYPAGSNCRSIVCRNPAM